MTQALTPSSAQRVWTAADLFERFGPIPLDRIRTDPPPGLATAADVERIDAHEDRICELVDGVLLEKPMGWIESMVALRLASFLLRYLDEHPLGIVLGEGGFVEFAERLIRIPDVCFISHEKLAGRDFSDRFAIPVAPDLAVEVVSPTNTQKEMDEKLKLYFEHGAALVWYIDPPTKSVRVHTAVDAMTTLGEADTLDGGEVLPGFSLEVAELFKMPGKAQ